MRHTCSFPFMPLNITVTTLWMKGNHLHTHRTPPRQHKHDADETLAGGPSATGRGRVPIEHSNRLFVDESEISLSNQTIRRGSCALRLDCSWLLHDVDVHRGEEVLQGLHDRRQPRLFRKDFFLYYTFCELRLKTKKDIKRYFNHLLLFKLNYGLK